MKLPSLTKRKPAAKPKAAAKPRAQINMPRPVEDIYRDMRDRRLLIPALALVIAIIAVPIALSVAKEEPPAPVAFVAPEGSEAVAPAVLTEQPVGVRDYRERLEELSSKNPFKAQVPTTPADVAAATQVTEPALPSDGSPTATATPSAPSTTAPSPTDTSDVSVEPATERVMLFVSPRLDVMAGPAGETREMRNQELGDRIPTKRRAPVAMFIGVSTDLNVAHFAISSGVTQTSGDGSCSPRGSRCEFLKLAVGERRTFTYGPGGKRYVIKVKDIREVVTKRRDGSPE